MNCLRSRIILLSLIVLPLVSIAQLQGQPFIDSLLKELPKMPDDTNKVNALGDISFNYRTIDGEKGILYAEKCLELAKKIDYRKAILYYDKALVIAKRIGNRKIQAQLLGNKGVIYFETEQYVKQQEVNQQALAIFRELGDENNEAWILSNQGDSYAQTGDFPKGIEYHRNAIEIYDRLNNQSYKSTCLLSIGTFYYEQAKRMKNNPAEARKLLNLSIETLRESERLLIELDDIDYHKDVYSALSNTQETAGDYASALKSFKSYTKLKDSIFSGEMEKSIAELETQREIEVREREIEIQELKKRTEFLYFAGGIALLLLIIGFTVANNLRQKKLNRLLSVEKQKSESLLHNILPEEVATELKAKGAADAKLFDEVTVLFTDFKGFTTIAETLTPKELVAEIDECFSAFDQIMEKHNVEKIKTIGDAYMAAGGLPVANTTNAVDVVNAALEIQQFMDQLSLTKKALGKEAFQIRIGVHTGPVVAGIVGVKKFAYDIWGDTVNTASRMESSGEPGRVNISGITHELVKDTFSCVYRGKIPAKNKGEIDMYFVG